MNPQIQVLNVGETCPYHSRYKGGQPGRPITRIAKSCFYCTEIWKKKNRWVDPDPEWTEQLRKLDEYLATVTDVTWHKGMYNEVQQPPETLYKK
jgi:hypothetical protein